MTFDIHSAPPRKGPQSAERLTPRERQVIELAHLRNEDIALALGCSTHTIRAHWEHIRAKLGVENKTAAVLEYLKRAA